MMRDFGRIREELGLKHYLDSPLGTLFLAVNEAGLPTLLVRSFDAELPPHLAADFADLIHAVRRWVLAHPEVSRLVDVAEPVEVGSDFVARPYHMYFNPIRAYEEWDDPPEPPRELRAMRSAVRAAIGGGGDPSNEVVEDVVAKTLLEPTSKVFFDEGRRRFVVAEPKIDSHDVERWAAISSATSG